MNKKTKREVKSLLLSISILTGIVAVRYKNNKEEIILPTEEPVISTTIPTSTPVINTRVLTTYDDYGFSYENITLYNDRALTNVAFELEPYQLLYRINTDGISDLVMYNNQMYYIKQNSLNILPETFVDVDISEQELNLYKNYAPICTSLIVSGKNSTPTNIGYFDIDSKTENTYLRGFNSDGSKYESYVNYWMPFDGGIGLHDADGWRSVYGGDIYKESGSHGCVNLPYTTAQVIYDNVEIGTMVLVHN